MGCRLKRHFHQTICLCPPIPFQAKAPIVIRPTTFALEEAQVGRITETRTGSSDKPELANLKRWGAKPARPVCPNEWLNRFPTHPGRLSNGMVTHREWYAFRFTTCLIKGLCRFDVIADALAEEGVFPVQAFSENHGPFAMASLWLNVIHDSVCGCYHEVVLSFDVNRIGKNTVAFRTKASQTPWASLYPNFGMSVCEAQFLHSLWIDSPLSIAWGREMQGFPKHPRPVDTSIKDDRKSFDFDLRWGDQLVMRGSTRKRFGLGGFLKESLGLAQNYSFGKVLGFLSQSSFEVPIIMPARSAQQHGNPRDYLAHLWKGLNPTAVQVWPWDPADSIEWGDVMESTGCESHNGHRLMKEADFQPVSVTYIPSAAAFVETKAK